MQVMKNDGNKNCDLNMVAIPPVIASTLAFCASVLGTGSTVRIQASFANLLVEVFNEVFRLSYLEQPRGILGSSNL